MNCWLWIDLACQRAAIAGDTQGQTVRIARFTLTRLGIFLKKFFQAQAAKSRSSFVFI